MKQVVHVIRREDIQKKLISVLSYELDYELASLHDAMEQHDSKEIHRSKSRLREIHRELEALHAF